MATVRVAGQERPTLSGGLGAPWLFIATLTAPDALGPDPAPAARPCSPSDRRGDVSGGQVRGGGGGGWGPAQGRRRLPSRGRAPHCSRGPGVPKSLGCGVTCRRPGLAAALRGLRGYPWSPPKTRAHPAAPTAHVPTGALGCEWSPFWGGRSQPVPSMVRGHQRPKTTGQALPPAGPPATPSCLRSP